MAKTTRTRLTMRDIVATSVSYHEGVPSGKSFTEYKAAVTNDRSAVIRQFLKTLGERYVNELELCRATHVSSSDVAKYREVFPAHIVPGQRAGGKKCFYWAGTVKLAKQMRSLSK